MAQRKAQCNLGETEITFSHILNAQLYSYPHVPLQALEQLKETECQSKKPLCVLQLGENKSSVAVQLAQTSGVAFLFN